MRWLTMRGRGFYPIEETDFERWRRVMSVNLDGTFLVSQAMTKLKKTRGAIVNIASISGLRPFARGLRHVQGCRNRAH